MIFLILDTNIWLYLANGYDPETSKNQDANLHFELLDSLKRLKESNDIRILANEVILAEWNRNKHHTLIKIQKLEKKKNNLSSVLKDALKYSSKDEAEKILSQAEKGITTEIEDNLAHIDNVEEFLHNHCEIIDIPDSIKLKIFDSSIGNKAPFHNDKNNIADATILFASDSFLNDKLGSVESSAIFVSNNHKDFTDGKNKDAFHPDILEQLECKEIKYERVLPAALKLSEAIIIQIQEYLEKEAWLESITFYCVTPYCEGVEDFKPWGYADRKRKVIWESDELVDPNQTSLFPELPAEEKEIQTVEMGDCVNCGTLHMDCPSCDEFIFVENPNDEFTCYECDIKMVFRTNEELNEECVYVLDNPEIQEN
nr:PIN domain-containing protein [uncultured Allomuricauda sp.]